jgi:hypothetical protein
MLHCINIMVHPEGALWQKGATLTPCWRRCDQAKKTQNTTICQKCPEASNHGASWGCTVQNGCYTHELLTQERPDQKHTKTQQFVRGAQRPTRASKTWCILRVHLEKRVLHLRTVDAGEARQKKQKTQQFVRGALASKSWCILRMHCVKWVLHSLPVDAGAARQKTQKRQQFVRNTKRPPCTSKHEGATWGCTVTKGCCTYSLLTQVQPGQKNTKHNNWSEMPRGQFAHQNHGAFWGCTDTNAHLSLHVPTR